MIIYPLYSIGLGAYKYWDNFNNLAGYEVNVTILAKFVDR